MELATPERIRTLQRKLYVKAKQEPGYRFYALYDKVYRADILSHAWLLVKANRGSPGIDGVSLAAIESGEGVERYLESISQTLRERSYRAAPVKRVMIPKPQATDGSLRPLGIPTIRDRIVQMAVKLIIEPIFEADFCDDSYGFRPKRNAHQAIDTIAKTMWRGHTEVIDADLSKYFDSIPHAKLMKVLAERIVDGALLALIRQWLKAPVMSQVAGGGKGDGGGRGGRNDTASQKRVRVQVCGGGKGNRRGTPQGGVISPLLSNLYLHLLDRIWQRHGLEQALQAKLVRYADDFVVLCRAGVQEPLTIIKQILERLDLTLNESKTKLIDANEASFHFLGFKVQMNRNAAGKRYPYIEPTDRAVTTIKARINEITARTQSWRPIDELVREMNRALRGWSGYFHIKHSTRQFRKVKRHSEERLRIQLRRRHNISDWKTAMIRYPRRVLNEKYGLYKLSTVAGWKSAHAST